MPSQWMSWIVLVAVCFGAAAAGGWFTDSSVKTWHLELLKPAGAPPAWVFGPVWSILYLLMAKAAWLVWQERHVHDLWLPLGLFFGQVFLNAAWSFICFGLQRPGFALIEILILLLAIVLTTTSSSSHSLYVFWLMTPYLGWVSYATYLNFGVWRLNRGAA
jgi:benzodiazapine receptor